MTTLEQRFGRRLRKIREQVGDSRQRLADIVGVDMTAVWRWERGDGSPRGPQMLRLLQHYAAHRNYLVDGDIGEEPPPDAHREVFEAFTRTKTGKRALAEGFGPELSSIHFPRTPTVQLYRAIALLLLNETEDEG